MADFTKKAITDSFIKMINEKPLDKITVKDIVEDCGINRRTFYYHFQDIYAVVDEIFDREANLALEKYGSPESWQEGFIVACRFALGNKKAIFHIYNSVSRENLEKYLHKIASRVMEVFVEKNSEGLSVSEADKKIIINVYRYALTGMIIEWISKGMKEDPEAMIRRIGFLFDGSVYTSLKRGSSSEGQN